MSKISIDGQIIGTDADRVDYKKNNAATVEDALDALFSGSGGDNISNADLAMLADKLLVTGGVNSARWEPFTYSQLKSNNHTIDNWETQDVTFDPSLTSGAGGGSERSVRFRVYKGDVIHYNDVGMYYSRPIVVTDMNFKVLYAADVPESTASGTYSVTEDGWVFGNAVIQASPLNQYIYAAWTDRKTVKGSKNLVYCACGDSISTDSGFTGGGNQRVVTYPRILAALMGADLDRHSAGGANITSMLTLSSWIQLCRPDSDLVTILFGANDQGQISESYTIGSASDVVGLDAVEDYETLYSTFIGKYKIVVDMMLARCPKAKIVCIGPIAMNSSSAETRLAAMRTEISALVSAMNNGRVSYVDGKATLLDYSAYYYDSSNGADPTHPNMVGEYVMAHNLYDKCVKGLLEIIR